MGALLSFLASIFGRFIGSQVVKFSAQKVLYYALVTTVLPAVLMTVFYRILTSLITIQNNIAVAHGGGIASSILELSGLAAWMANELRLPDAFALIISAALFRYAVSLIPKPGVLGV